MSLPGFPEAAQFAGLAEGILIGFAAALMLLALGRIAGVSGVTAQTVGFGDSGRGIADFCPGPGIAALVIAAMFAGMAVVRLAEGTSS